MRPFCGDSGSRVLLVSCPACGAQTEMDTDIGICGGCGIGLTGIIRIPEVVQIVNVNGYIFTVRRN